MDNRRGLGLVLSMTGAMLIVAHLFVVADLYRQGADPDAYADAGGNALASSYAVPMGAGAIGIGILLFANGVLRKAESEEPKASDARPAVRKYLPVGVMAGGILIMALHVAMLRSLVLRVEAAERDPTFVAEGPVFEAQRAETRSELERINAIHYIGMAIAAAGLALTFGGRPKREPDPTG